MNPFADHVETVLTSPVPDSIERLQALLHLRSETIRVLAQQNDELIAKLARLERELGAQGARKQ